VKTEILDLETQNADWQKIDYRPFVIEYAI